MRDGAEERGEITEFMNLFMAAQALYPQAELLDPLVLGSHTSPAVSCRGSEAFLRSFLASSS